MNKPVELFCDVDFCKIFNPEWHNQLLEIVTRKRQRECRITAILSIIIWDM